MAAKKLRELRKKAGLTLIDVAEVLGVSESQVSRYETGARRPRLDEAYKLAQLFRVSVVDIFPDMGGSPAIAPEPSSSLAERFHAATMKRLPEANQEALQSSELLEVLRVILDVPLTDHLSAEELQKRIELAQSVVRQLKRSERPH